MQLFVGEVSLICKESKIKIHEPGSKHPQVSQKEKQDTIAY